MSRNAILVLALAVTGMTGALAKPPGKIYRLGLLGVSLPVATWRGTPQYRSLIEGLQQLGYVEGRNLAIDMRSAENKLERLPELPHALFPAKGNALWWATA